MNFGIIGLGKMGAAIAQRVVAAGYRVWGYDPSEAGRQAGHDAGVTMVTASPEITQHARVIWLMVPAGAAVDMVIKELIPHLKPGTSIIDGGNSNFVDSMRRAQYLADKYEVAFLDCGTSGGVHGLDHGFSLMVGGDAVAYAQVSDFLTAIAAPHGVAHVGPSGAGHYVKMVHNGIEYGLMQAYAEGLQLLREGSFKDAQLDLNTITGVWQNGSVIRSFLLNLAHDVVARDQELAHISGAVAETGMGAWTASDAHKHHVPIPVLDAALKARADSRLTGGTYATKIVAMLRNAFGGHSVGKKD